MDVRVGHPSAPYRLDVAYAGGRPIGRVEKIVMDDPNPDRMGPYIRRALRGRGDSRSICGKMGPEA